MASKSYEHVLSRAFTSAEEDRKRQDRIAQTADRFLDALFIAMQSEKGRKGFAYDLRWCAGLCRATWRDQAVWNGLVHVQRGPKKRTHLMYAAKSNAVAFSKWLLKRGALLELKDTDGHTALFWAAGWGNLEATRILIDAGANLTARPHLIYTASSWGHTKIVRILIEEGADVNIELSDGSTPLFVASEEGHVDVIRVLLANGADFRSMNDGFSPLAIATQNNHFKVVHALLALGANVTSATNTGATSFHIACKEGHTDIAIALLNAGADTRLLNNAGKTALELASPETLAKIVLAALADGRRGQQLALVRV